MKTVKDLMTTNIKCCVRDTSLQEVAKMMVDCNCGEIPVVNTVDQKRPVGVITDRDITCRTVAEGKNPLDLTAQDCMTSSVTTAREDTSIDDCMELMEEKQIRRIPVVDQDGAVCGMIAQADLAKNVDKSDAGEIVREVSRPSEQSSAQLH